MGQCLAPVPSLLWLQRVGLFFSRLNYSIIAGKRRDGVYDERQVAYQHRCSNVELLLVLSDKDVRLDEVLRVLLFDLAKYVGQPLELALSPCHPHEVDLSVATRLTLHCRRNIINFFTISIVIIITLFFVTPSRVLRFHWDKIGIMRTFFALCSLGYKNVPKLLHFIDAFNVTSNNVNWPRLFGPPCIIVRK